jgi:hypothetical protein
MIEQQPVDDIEYLRTINLQLADWELQGPRASRDEVAAVLDERLLFRRATDGSAVDRDGFLAGLTDEKNGSNDRSNLDRAGRKAALRDDTAGRECTANESQQRSREPGPLNDRDDFRDARRSGKLGAKSERADGGCGADDSRRRRKPTGYCCCCCVLVAAAFFRSAMIRS